MKREQAIKLAMRALESKRHQIAVDADLADHYGADYPHALTASQTRRQINEALDELRKILDELKAARQKPLLKELERKQQRQAAKQAQPALFEEIQ